MCEFRSFVVAGKLTCLSQYYTQCFFPAFTSAANRALVLEQVFSFFAAVRDKIPLDRYCMDFVVFAPSAAAAVTADAKLPSSDTKEQLPSWPRAADGQASVLVLELNPFNKSTGLTMTSYASPVLA